MITGKGRDRNGIEGNDMSVVDERGTHFLSIMVYSVA